MRSRLEVDTNTLCLSTYDQIEGDGFTFNLELTNMCDKNHYFEKIRDRILKIKTLVNTLEYYHNTIRFTFNLNEKLSIRISKEKVSSRLFKLWNSYRYKGHLIYIGNNNVHYYEEIPVKISKQIIEHAIQMKDNYFEEKRQERLEHEKESRIEMWKEIMDLGD